MGGSILEWVSVFLVGLGLGLSVAVLVILWQVWGSTDRSEQAGKERLEMLREQQERLEHLHEERQVLLEEMERLREQKERLQWLREGRAALLAELTKLRSQLEEQRKRVEPPQPTDTKPLLRLVALERVPAIEAPADNSTPDASGTPESDDEGERRGGGVPHAPQDATTRPWWQRIIGR